MLVLFLQQLGRDTPRRSGVATIPITVVMFAPSGPPKRLAMRFGPRLFMCGGPLLCAGRLLRLSRLTPGLSSWRALLPPLVLFSIGVVSIVSPLTATVLADAGIDSDVNNVVLRIAGLLGIAIAGAAVGGRPNRLDTRGFGASMTITAALLALGGAIGLLGISNIPAADGGPPGW